jgi:fibronectin type 3 domain-containing protein
MLTGLVATRGDAQVSLNWTDNTESDLWVYNVYRSETSGGPYNKVNASLVWSSSYTDTGLTNDTTYYYVVTALDYGNNESGNSNEDNATPTDLPPAAPTNLVATPGGEEISLDWYDNTDYDLDGYNVYRSETSGGPYNKVNASLVSTISYTDTGLYGGGTYYYVVTAVDLTSNESGYSNEGSATATDVAPGAPTGLTTTPGDKQVVLGWADNTESELAGYNVYRSQTMGGPYSKINTSLVVTSGYTDTGLTGGVTYYYVVTAVDNGSNESSYSDSASAIPTDPPPGAPTNLVATLGDEEISLDWDDNTELDLAGYNVYRSQTMGGPYSKINVGLVATSGYTDTGLYGGGTYYYVYRALRWWHLLLCSDGGGFGEQREQLLQRG